MFDLINLRLEIDIVLTKHKCVSPQMYFYIEAYCRIMARQILLRDWGHRMPGATTPVDRKRLSPWSERQCTT